MTDAKKTLPVSNWKNLSFYSGFNYMHLIASGHLAIPFNTGTRTVVIPTGTYVPFAEVYYKDTAGAIYNGGGFFNIGTDWNINRGILTINTNNNSYTDAYYFIYRSNAA